MEYTLYRVIKFNILVIVFIGYYIPGVTELRYTPHDFIW